MFFDRPRLEVCFLFNEGLALIDRNFKDRLNNPAQPWLAVPKLLEYCAAVHRKGVCKPQFEFGFFEIFSSFFSDVPHLTKTVRNNFSSSGGGKRTRHLWLNGKDLLWSHITDIYDRDVAGQLRRTKLTHDHVYLTPASVMNVKLAAQVLTVLAK
ncbi:hypothetical protein BaRGS_00024150 [Batillaria attramentaria]|uniref:Uncharacterized protein n=1 Tax=Batillaria attramentaria TaxID=370345 RepID=A0ABD0KBX2_9CAEN